jgi:hypothetical protein
MCPFLEMPVSNVPAISDNTSIELEVTRKSLRNKLEPSRLEAGPIERWPPHGVSHAGAVVALALGGLLIIGGRHSRRIGW